MRMPVDTCFFCLYASMCQLTHLTRNVVALSIWAKSTLPLHDPPIRSVGTLSAISEYSNGQCTDTSHCEDSDTTNGYWRISNLVQHQLLDNGCR